MLRTLPIIIVAMTAHACGFKIEVGKKERERPEFIPDEVGLAIADVDNLAITDVDRFLKALRKPDSDEGRILVEELKQGLRSRLRKTFLDLEKRVIELTSQEQTIDFGAGLFQDLKPDIELPLYDVDLMLYPDFSQLDSVLWSAAFLVAEQGSSAKLDIKELPDLDLVSTLLFYDMGVLVEGGGYRVETGEHTHVVSDFQWQLIEEPDAPLVEYRKSRIVMDYVERQDMKSVSLNWDIIPEDERAILYSLTMNLSLGSSVIQSSLILGRRQPEGSWLSQSFKKVIDIERTDNGLLVWRERWLDHQGEYDKTASIDLKAGIATLLEDQSSQVSLNLNPGSP
ncbi:hypothetical protein [Pseudobacteriovorax antillogorgiicola]|uniref:Uncharacterized protein n=1 Tax=Pseudobacteriovorax antillogorgiicola TaxID=1513793 RepID=A0A1Y6BZD1_9BACT|nr:hypothetical protein [Pseudobacteriovorax antillogorgiicola]TCS51282.1 hypothetical protein EDD56_111167 [Pseudobacteriovorax antillogorgiicola]SMF36209.1 hypothetical protein SAMN06296036_11111 [Pseudobacteriovorax antillogorgiicola]